MDLNESANPGQSEFENSTALQSRGPRPVASVRKMRERVSSRVAGRETGSTGQQDQLAALQIGRATGSRRPSARTCPVAQRRGFSTRRRKHLGRRAAGCLSSSGSRWSYLQTIILIHCVQFVLSASACAQTDRPNPYFEIQVVDQATGRGVPLVELKTVHNVRYYTDSAGRIAFLEPGLMDQSVYFHVRSHGYEIGKDGFGYRGVRLQIQPGGKATVRVERKNLAERLYRITGAGIYRDTVLLGLPTPTNRPVLNGEVLGSDSVVNTRYRDQIYWFWGDTNRPSYPLGNFHVPGAVSELPEKGGLDPAEGVDLTYFTNDSGFARPMAKLPGPGPTWINGLVVLKGEDDRERMFSTYVKIKPPLTVYERGLAEFNDQTLQFEKVVEFDLDAPLLPGGHPFVHVHEGTDYLHFGNPFPLVRVRAEPASLRDLGQYEAYTCLKAGSRSDDYDVELREGQPVFGWKRDTIPYTPKLQDELLKEKLIQPDQALFQLYDDDGKLITIHRGSVVWNEFRKSYVMIAGQSFGSSLLGEIWFAESDSVTGPWRNAHKILTHDKYSFYNPKQHPLLVKSDSRYLYFEGTYTTLFSGNTDPTPRYDYNQIMYRLDLADPRLKTE